MRILMLLAILLSGPWASAYDVKKFYSIQCSLSDPHWEYLLDRVEVGLNLNRDHFNTELAGDGTVTAPIAVQYLGSNGGVAVFKLSMQVVETGESAGHAQPMASDLIEVQFNDADFIEGNKEIGHTVLETDPIEDRRYELTCDLHQEPAMPY